MSYGNNPIYPPKLMNTVAKGGEKEKQTEAAPKVHRIRITLTSRHVKNVEKGSAAKFR